VQKHQTSRGSSRTEPVPEETYA